MACYVENAVYKPKKGAFIIHYIDTAGSAIMGEDGRPMVMIIDLATATALSDGFIDLKDSAYAKAISGYQFTSAINTTNSQESKILVAAEYGALSGIPESRLATVGGVSGYMVRFAKYADGVYYAAMGNRGENERFALTGRAGAWMVYKKN